MKDEYFIIRADGQDCKLTAATLGEICRALGEDFTVEWDDPRGIGFRRISNV